MISNYTCARDSVNDDNLRDFQGDKFSLKFILMSSSRVGTAQRADVLATPDLAGMGLHNRKRRLQTIDEIMTRWIIDRYQF